MADVTLRIEPVQSRQDFREFLKLPFRLCAKDPHWIAPLDFDVRQRLNPKKAPFYQHGEVALWVAWRGTICVGRISAQVNRAHLALYRDSTGHFGFLEAEDDAEVFAALFEAANAWLRARGMTRICGPFALSINEESGLLVEGFDTSPYVMMGHALPYYAQRLEELGFSKTTDLIAYRYSFQNEPPRAAMNLLAKARRKTNLRFRHLDWSRYDEELALIVDIFNDAWAGNWGFVPMSQAEISHMANSLKPIIRDRYIWFAEVDDVPVAMVVTIPNINEAIADMKGRLLPFNWLKLLWRLKVSGLASARMPLMGVRREYHGTLLGATLALGVIECARDYHAGIGTQMGELSWILEENEPVHRLIKMMGGQRSKTYRLYEKALS